MEKNLHDNEAIEKLKKMAKDISVCMMLTKSETPEESCRPMAVADVDDEGSIWFFSRRHSAKIFEIESNNKVQLVFSHPGKESFINLWGNAIVTDDRNKIDELWNPLIKAWFPKGKDDPEICLVKVSPAEAYYWDGGEGRMVAFLKMVASVVTGKKLAEGEEGVLDLK